MLRAPYCPVLGLILAFKIPAILARLTLVLSLPGITSTILLDFFAVVIIAIRCLLTVGTRITFFAIAGVLKVAIYANPSIYAWLVLTFVDGGRGGGGGCTGGRGGGGGGGGCGSGCGCSGGGR